MVVKIEPDRWCGSQHLDGDVRRRRARNPGSPLGIDVLARARAVIDLVSRIIDVLRLRFNIYRRRLNVLSSITGTINIADATG